MTLAEGKRKVYMLIDEYSAGGVETKDQDIELKMADFFDMAQKDVAKRQRIVKLWTVDTAPGEYVPPENFQKVYRVWVNGKVRNGKYRFKNGLLVVPAGDSASSIEVEYFAAPATIGPETENTHEFEVKEDGCMAMCYYVAAQQLFVDLVVDYRALYQEYLRQLSELDTSLPGGSIGPVMNTLWR